MPHISKSTEIVDGKHRRTWMVTCDLCGHTEKRVWRELSDETIVERNFKNQGWIVGKQNVCPACQDQERERNNPMAPPTPKITDSYSTAQALNAVKVFKKLEEVFVDGRFADGWSDERVGKECGGISKQFVASIREVEFGPIRNPELDAIKSDVATIEGMLAEVKVRLSKVEARG